MIKGIAEGVTTFLENKERSYFHDRRPSVYVPKLFQEAVKGWLEENGATLLGESESI